MARTLLLWLKLKGGMALGDMRVEECRAFMVAQNIPTDWIFQKQSCTRHAWLGTFRGQLTPASRQNYLDVISSLLAISHCPYLKANPWKLVNTRIETEENTTVR